MAESMNEKVVLVTGATEGIGHQTALELARLGARVLVHGRSEEKAGRAVDALVRALGRGRQGGGFTPVWGDLASLSQVRALADQVLAQADWLDVLINNAGVYMRERVLTPDGVETTFAVNHLAHFLLTRRLRPLLEAAKAGRIVNVGSQVHHGGHFSEAIVTAEQFSGYQAYADSKLCNALFTVELAERLSHTRVTANCLHPGVIGTKLLRGGFGMSGGGSLESGAKTSVWAASAAELEGVSGRYFSDSREAAIAAAARDPAARKALWALSERLVGEG